MDSVGLFKRGWKWLHPKKQAFTSIGVAAGFARERLLFLFDRLWPLIYRLCVIAASFLLGLLLQWRKCAVGGVRSVFSLGPTALFVILWSCFLCLASTTSLIYVLLSLMVCWKGSLGTTVKLLLGHEFKSWKQPLAKKAG